MSAAEIALITLGAATLVAVLVGLGLQLRSTTTTVRSVRP